MDLLKINKNMKNDYKKFEELESKVDIKKEINNIVLDILNGENATRIYDERVIKTLGIKFKKGKFDKNILYWEVKIIPELVEKVEKYLEEN